MTFVWINLDKTLIHRRLAPTERWFFQFRKDGKLRKLWRKCQKRSMFDGAGFRPGVMWLEGWGLPTASNTQQYVKKYQDLHHKTGWNSFLSRKTKLRSDSTLWNDIRFHFLSYSQSSSSLTTDRFLKLRFHG